MLNPSGLSTIYFFFMKSICAVFEIEREHGYVFFQNENIVRLLWLEARFSEVKRSSSLSAVNIMKAPISSDLNINLSSIHFIFIPRYKCFFPRLDWCGT